VKKCNRLQQVLKPEAENHRKRATDDLKKYMVSLEELFNSCHRSDSIPLLHEAKSHLHLAMKGIVMENKPKELHDDVLSKKLKPTLNTSDLDFY
jgi:hypothetical protein